jgi:hypothetical protein
MIMRGTLGVVETTREDPNPHVILLIESQSPSPRKEEDPTPFGSITSPVPLLDLSKLI